MRVMVNQVPSPLVKRLMKRQHRMDWHRNRSWLRLRVIDWYPYRVVKTMAIVTYMILLPLPHPVFIDVFNLSPASETQSPGVAYKARTLGDIDAESFVTYQRMNLPVA